MNKEEKPGYLKCCFCQRADEGVKILKDTKTPMHPNCLGAAWLGSMARKFGGFVEPVLKAG